MSAESDYRLMISYGLRGNDILSFSKKFGICLCFLPASLGILAIVFSKGDLGWVIVGIFLLLLALILLIPGIIFLIVGIKKDNKKKTESEASMSEQGFQSYSESKTDKPIKKEKKIKEEKIKKKNIKKQSEQEFTMEDFD